MTDLEGDSSCCGAGAGLLNEDFLLLGPFRGALAGRLAGALSVIFIAGLVGPFTGSGGRER